MASIVLAIFAASTTLWIVADVLGFVVSLLYAVELCLLRENPPLNLSELNCVMRSVTRFRGWRLEFRLPPIFKIWSF